MLRTYKISLGQTAINLPENFKLFYPINLIACFFEKKKKNLESLKLIQLRWAAVPFADVLASTWVHLEV